MEPVRKYLLFVDKFYLYMKIIQGKTALMLASFDTNSHGKSLEMVKKLRNYGANYETKDLNGCTALHYAIDGGNISILKFILQDGADINATDSTSGIDFHA